VVSAGAPCPRFPFPLPADPYTPRETETGNAPDPSTTPTATPSTCAPTLSTGLLRVVVVQVLTGNLGLRVFFSTDPTVSAPDILERYGERWFIELAFRNLKQLLGFGQSSARKRQAVERTAPFVGITYSFLVLWFVDHVFGSPSELAVPPVRPWYRHKHGLSFADVLRTAQRVLAPLDVLDPDRDLANLHQLPSMKSAPSRVPIKRVA